MDSDGFLQRRPSTANVSWPTKIRGAIQVGHGLGDAIRGSLGATDIKHNNYTSSHEIAQRGRHEIATGLARMRGVPAFLPPAPVYDRRHSFPLQQYEPERTFWGPSARPAGGSVHRRQTRSHEPPRDRMNPSTASEPFNKYYEHPYLEEPSREQDPGFAGVGAGIDVRKHPPVQPAFMAAAGTEAASGPSGASASDSTPYSVASPNRASANVNSNSLGVGPTHNRLRKLPRSRLAFSETAPYASSPYRAAELQQRSQPEFNLPRVQVQEEPEEDRDRRSRGGLGRKRSLSLSAMFNRTRQSLRWRPSGRSTGKNIDAAEAEHSSQANERGSLPDDTTTTNLNGAAQSASGSAISLGTASSASHASRPPHQHESALETAGYDVLSYDVKDTFPQWPPPPAESQGAGSSSQRMGRLEPVRSVYRRG
ncbi:hypothetical protein HMN09_00178200 [Mycena chlorophos]|uniref:Uncharacterized protein n=1 Tax=Mycena chlorophos TaxID=658473 RepID=A0A8H6TKZ8_MYCCL|nr:hypothetical protein HMN09_00178200 [Mycena chlorophos]